MENREAARALFGVAALLESEGANPYRVRAYRRAAQLFLLLPVDGRTLVTEGGELAVPGLGIRLRRKLGELVTSGRMGFHEAIVAALPEPKRALLSIDGVGPKTAARLEAELGLRGAADVAAASQAGRLRTLRGIGPRREAQLGAAARAALGEVA